MVDVDEYACHLMKKRNIINGYVRITAKQQQQKTKKQNYF
tara:strand:+ start:254 stop:373 length:120 start_codon:yes stop_codon:yes gene_type:complete